MLRRDITRYIIVILFTGTTQSVVIITIIYNNTIVYSGEKNQ